VTAREAGAVGLPERLAHSLRAAGEAGEQWLAALPDLLASLESDWSITVGDALSGGNAAYVAEALRADGRPVVLKVALPTINGFAPFGQELRALRLADGDPYVTLLRFDQPRQSMLLERLGSPLGWLGWPVPQQLDALVHTVARGWRPMPVDPLLSADRLPDPDALPDGASKARWLADFVVSAWEDLSRPCPEATVAEAARCAAAREAALDSSRTVLVHGDAHPFNLLQASDGAFRLIDPEGLASEPAHDLGVILRDFNDDLLAKDPRIAMAIARGRCRRAGELARIDPEAIWQWAFTERVSTGLFLLSLGHDQEAETFLTVAAKLTGTA
jgi:streptomycin 6-kinase